MSLIDKLPPIRGKYRYDADLSKMCWMGVGGTAQVLFQPLDLEDLVNFMKNKPSSISCFIFGVGSNLLIKDTGVTGVMIRLGRGFNYASSSNNNLIVGAACMDINAAMFAQENSIAGLEFLSGIPGTIGGAIAMNAGAYGTEIKNVLIKAKAVNLQGEIKEFSAADLGFIYRGNSLKEFWIFVEAELRGNIGNCGVIKQKINDIQIKRASTQPIKSKTCGSTFKNFLDVNAWKLIDQAGCRGLKIGGVQVSKMHSNFLINTGGATSADVEMLISEVKRRVLETSGIHLQEEIRIIGN